MYGGSLESRLERRGLGVQVLCSMNGATQVYRMVKKGFGTLQKLRTLLYCCL